MPDASRRAELRRLLTLIVVVAAAVLIAEWYYGTLHRDYYFPDRYEDVFAGVFRTFVIGLMTVIAYGTRIWSRAGSR